MAIKQTSLPYFKCVRELVDLLHYNVGIDFFVYTPQEFSEAVRTKLFFSKEIVKKGKTLYEKDAREFYQWAEEIVSLIASHL